MTRGSFGRLMMLALLAAMVAGCGKYGPPVPIAPEPQEISEDEEERR